MNLGPAEILVILVVALVVFGPKRLPEVGRQVGKAVRELRKMQDTVKGELEHVMHHDVMGGSATSSTYETETDSTNDGTESKVIEEGDHSTPSSSGPNGSGPNRSGPNASTPEIAMPEVSGNGSRPEPHVIDAGDTDDGFAAPGTFS
jgi:Tat protein translocase TatB subunit